MYSVAMKKIVLIVGEMLMLQVVLCRSVNLIKLNGNEVAENIPRSDDLIDLLNENVISIHKCCKTNQFYSHTTNECEHFSIDPLFVSNRTKLLKENISSIIDVFPSLSTPLPITISRPKCHDAATEIKDLDDFYLNSTTGQLCKFENELCYSFSEYCIEEFIATIEARYKVEICPFTYFRKCCNYGQKYTYEGCINASSPSPGIENLLNTMETTYGPPNCDHYPLGPAFNTDPSQIEVFNVTSSGHLRVIYNNKTFNMTNYCIDDITYIDNTSTSYPVAIVCKLELHPYDVDPVGFNNLSPNVVGKCCLEGYPLIKTTNAYKKTIFSCSTDADNFNFLADKSINASNVISMEYTFFPQCENGNYYHNYELSTKDQGDNFLDTSQRLVVKSKIGQCLRSKIFLNKSMYCLDYVIEGEDTKVLAFVCPANMKNYESLHPEKSTVITTLLGISCVALITTAAHISSMKVRRGQVTVNRVTTLSRGILLSCVASYTIGNLVLAVSYLVEMKSGSDGCHAVAGLIMFFMLAAYNWNTSICMESLLLTLSVQVSEGNRYLIHSLWAWVLPGLITGLTFTMDAYKEHLPCGTITPDIGEIWCFFSNSSAQILYFYLPMGITLLANICLLLGVKILHRNALKRLANGIKKKGGTIKMEMQEDGTSIKRFEKQSSGLKITQIKSLWADAVMAMKLVMWSGVTLSVEVISFYISRFQNAPDGSWDEYLWYIPLAINSLRGFGIFVILVLMDENVKKKIAKILKPVSSLYVRLFPSTHQSQSTDKKGTGISPRPTNSSVTGNSISHTGTSARNMDTVMENSTSEVTTGVDNKGFKEEDDLNCDSCTDSSSPQRMDKSLSQIESKKDITQDVDTADIEDDIKHHVILRANKPSWHALSEVVERVNSESHSTKL